MELSAILNNNNNHRPSSKLYYNNKVFSRPKRNKTLFKVEPIMVKATLKNQTLQQQETVSLEHKIIKLTIANS